MGRGGLRVKRLQRLTIEPLEDRAVPATFGVPWQDAANLTLSFAPDGTSIAGHTSSLFQTLNSQMPTAVWEQTVLRAFQTWAVQANINIGVVADSGDPFGVSGASQHDPRFGDIRVGAQPMAPDALSVSVPNDPALSSTWTGDVLINSSDKFGGNQLDLFSVMLHEAGHVFGLPDSTDPNSPMYPQYTGYQRLTSRDIKNIQALYGARVPDIHEGSGCNDTMNKATQVQPPGSYTGATPLVTYGDITTNKDIDFYAIKPPSNYNGPITFRLQSTGISLLTTHLTILDSKGNVLGDAQASSDFGDTVTVHLNQSSSGATYFVEVRGATQDVFGIGSYGLAATFDAVNTVSPSTLNTVLRGPYQTLGPNDLYLLLTNPGQVLFNNIDHDGSAVQLTSMPGYAQNTRFEAVGSIATATDVNLYRIQPPNVSSNQTLVLTATVRGLSPDGTVPRVTILDGDLIPVNAQILANGDGTFTVQAAGLSSGGNYFMKVTPNTSLADVSGNYVLDATFGTAAANLATFGAGSLTSTTTQQGYNFYVGESQLMQLVLSASAVGAPAGTAVQMTITDAAGKVVYSLNAAAGDTVSGPAAFFTPGAYSVHFTLQGVTDPNAPAVSFSLLGEAISDPIGPVYDDPLLTPIYSSPTMTGFFTYPDGTTTTSTYLFVLIV